MKKYQEQQISYRLKKSREKAGFLTAIDFCAQNSQHGITYSTYVNHENGIRIPKNHTVKKYAELMGVNYLWLLEGDGEMKSPESPEESRIQHVAPPSAKEKKTVGGAIDYFLSLSPEDQQSFVSFIGKMRSK